MPHTPTSTDRDGHGALGALAPLTQLQRLAVFMPPNQHHRYAAGTPPPELGALTALTFLSVWVRDDGAAWPAVLGAMRQLRELRLHLVEEAPSAALLRAIGGLPQLRTLHLVVSLYCYDLVFPDCTAEALRGVPEVVLHASRKVRCCEQVAAVVRLPNLLHSTWESMFWEEPKFVPKGVCRCLKCARAEYAHSP